MNVNISNDTSGIKKQRRFVTLDFGRGIAIVVMLFLHIVQRTLDYDNLLADMDALPMINLFALVLIPFFGGLAGFFLIISSASNMVSMYKDLEKGKTVKSLVFKQIIGGVLLLIFAMLCEGLIGYQGLLGNFFKNLTNPAATEWQVMLWRWNFFETIHTIAWCIIINGCIQGLLSLKGNWRNTKNMIISYIVLAVGVIGLTQLVWYLVGLIPGYPFGSYPSGSDHILYLPWIGTESFWQILRAPFLNMLAAPMEPLFPYLAVSFIGSIIGIVLSKPRKEISQKMPRRGFLIGLGMFLGGLVGILIVLMKVMGATYNDPGLAFIITVSFYFLLPNHRAWGHDNPMIDFPTETVAIPKFAWLGQFLAVTGFSIMLIMLLFRMIEFRNKSKQFADKSKIIRRFGVVAFTNYNNQWIFFIVFNLALLTFGKASTELFMWGGVFLIIIVTYLVYSLILFLWEKIKYTGSLEWMIRTFANSVVPVRRQRYDDSVKWWQRGQVDVENTFNNPVWINLGDPSEIKDAEEVLPTNNDESKLALIFSIVGICSILFIVTSIFGL
ncbi:MAG: hypothetical protein ACTSSH_13310, partial [Candidatus Heimdallarchaeota archaeon]